MPLYEYQCHDCGKTFEFIQSVSDKPLTNCEECNGRLEKLINKGTNFQLKGKGWTGKIGKDRG